MHDLRDVGGTPGGIVYFLIGLGLLIGGGWLFMDRVTVFGGYWTMFGSQGSSFGITLIPVMLGIAMLFYNGSSILGWVLFGGGLVVIFTGVIANLNVHFRSTTLTSTLIMLGLIGAGIGLIIRSLRPVSAPAKS